MEMMGDPTLRLHPVSPPSGLTGLAANGKVDLTWGASPDASLQGYHVYRSASATGPYSRINGSLITTTKYTDSGQPSGSYTYMVRAVKLEGSGSGTYFNPSQGTTLTLAVTNIPNGGNAPPSVTLISPADGAIFSEPANITLTASASDSDGVIQSVEFLADTVSLGTVTSNPYTLVWTGVGVGSHTLTARATDNAGASAMSAPIVVRVQAPLNITQQDDFIVISWSGGGTLESAPAIDGPWLPVSTATPYFEPLLGSQKFFRVR